MSNDDLTKQIREICEYYGLNSEVLLKYEAAADAVYNSDFFSTAHIMALAEEGELLDGNMRAFADRFDAISTGDNKNHSIYEHIFKARHDIPLCGLKPTNDFQRVFLERALRGEKIYRSYGLMK